MLCITTPPSGWITWKPIVFLIEKVSCRYSSKLQLRMDGWVRTSVLFSAVRVMFESCATFFCSRFNHPEKFSFPALPPRISPAEVKLLLFQPLHLSSKIGNQPDTFFGQLFPHDSGFKNNQNCPEELQHFQTYCICMYLLHDIIAVHSGGHIHTVLTINQVNVL